LSSIKGGLKGPGIQKIGRKEGRATRAQRATAQGAREKVKGLDSKNEGPEQKGVGVAKLKDPCQKQNSAKQVLGDGVAWTKIVNDR